MVLLWLLIYHIVDYGLFWLKSIFCGDENFLAVEKKIVNIKFFFSSSFYVSLSTLDQINLAAKLTKFYTIIYLIEILEIYNIFLLEKDLSDATVNFIQRYVTLVYFISYLVHCNQIFYQKSLNLSHPGGGEEKPMVRCVLCYRFV